MKKVFSAILGAALLCAALAGCSSDPSVPEESFPMTGRYLRPGESHLIIPENGGATVMNNGTDDTSIFDGLDTGDKIEVVCDYILESYPASTTIYSCKLLEDGSPEDLPQDEIDTLAEMGWTID